MKSDRISTVVLWVCMLITVCLSAWFYFVHFSGSRTGESPEISALIAWAMFIPALSILLAALFFVLYLAKNVKKIGRSIIMPIFIAILLIAGFYIGSGKAENTYIWLKITDMWIYAIYALIALALTALIGGIFWSYLKKIR
ncbi:MAG: hypothetical protein LBR13_05020 [Dysgonamonadaceae bacterium]|jgi:hypothetical protein|nr:hypothetical protein [Dysgonamonadaceae bacterium]